jgi:hypothetical protein
MEVILCYLHTLQQQQKNTGHQSYVHAALVQGGVQYRAAALCTLWHVNCQMPTPLDQTVSTITPPAHPLYE